MKVGFRKPSLKKSLNSRTTAKWKSQTKKAIIPSDGKKGTSWLKKQPIINFTIKSHLLFLIF